MKTLLILDPNKELGKKLCSRYKMDDYEIIEVVGESEALQLVNSRNVDVVIADIDRMGSEEIDFISYIKVNIIRCEVVVAASIENIEKATKAMRRGAFLYLLKPVKCEDVMYVLEKVSQRQEKDIVYLESQSRLMRELVGNEDNMRRILNICEKVAPTDSSVLVGGESGTGKEVLARYIHMKSRRSDGPFIAINCGAIPDNLIESELFGHVKGSFTGANFNKPGLLEEGNLGTVFLDEIGDLSTQAQVKILRFLQDYEVRQVGSNSTKKVDVRIIAATNKDLIKEIREEKFREDLFYRINIVQINIPPLRERRKNIEKLLPFFLFKYASKVGIDPPEFSKDAEVILNSYSYPGNIRELENIVERAIVLSEDGLITRNSLPDSLYKNRNLLEAPQDPEKGKLDEILSLPELEKRHIRKVLDRVKGNHTVASRMLGISRSTLWRKIKEYGLEN
ncbi:MAG: sigma-54-dependent transcriptional regulator [Fibrobacterota bacterium]